VLTINSGYTLTQSGNVSISIPTVNVNGTWANAGYGITIPSGSTVQWFVPGSVTTASTPGTLTVDGTCYWNRNGITVSTSNAQASFVLSLAGTGIFIGGPAYQGTATQTITLSSTSIAAGGTTSSSVTSSGGTPEYNFSSVSGSAVGKYTLGEYNSTAGTYVGFVIIYIGTASYSYSFSYGDYPYAAYIAAGDTSGDTYYAMNMSGSAGTITLTGGANL